MLFTVQLHQRTDARACDPDFDQFQDIRNFVQLRTTFLTTSAVRYTPRPCGRLFPRELIVPLS